MKLEIAHLVHQMTHQMYLLRSSFRLRRLRAHSPLPALPGKGDEQLDILLQNSAAYFESVMRPFVTEYNWPLAEVYNGFFESLDVEFYYCIVRTLHPRRIIEIGSGWATRFALRALSKNGQGYIYCIDPEPRRRLPASVEHIRARVEDVDPKVFDLLQAGDILFIDSSHTRSEAEYHVREILPRLRSGVIIHHHDVMYPYPRLFDEEEVLFDFYKQNTPSFRLLSGLAFVRHERPDLCQSLAPSFRLLPQRVPGSLWATRTSE